MFITFLKSYFRFIYDSNYKKNYIIMIITIITKTDLSLNDIHFGKCPISEMNGFKEFVILNLKQVVGVVVVVVFVVVVSIIFLIVIIIIMIMIIVIVFYYITIMVKAIL